MPASIATATVDHPSAWYGRDLAADPRWLVSFTAGDLAEIDAALHGVAGLAMADITRETFHLPTLADKLAEVLTEIRTGRGFVVLRGLPVQTYTDEEVGRIFWGLGTWLGSALRQNPQGDLLGHVFDHGRTYGQIDVRGYETRAHLPFHSDGCDLVGLLCLRPARRGGLSSIVSAVTIHNEILRRRPDLLPPLYEGFHYIKREAALTDQPITPHRVPVFGFAQGHISCRLVRNQINAAAENCGAPMSADGKAALDLLDSLAQDPGIHLDMDLQQGDMQLCNNYTVLHSRTEFEDFPEPERRRHMIRLWLKFREKRPMGPAFLEQKGYGGIAEIGFAA